MEPMQPEGSVGLENTAVISRLKWKPGCVPLVLSNVLLNVPSLPQRDYNIHMQPSASLLSNQIRGLGRQVRHTKVTRKLHTFCFRKPLVTSDVQT